MLCVSLHLVDGGDDGCVAAWFVAVRLWVVVCCSGIWQGTRGTRFKLFSSMSNAFHGYLFRAGHHMAALSMVPLLFQGCSALVKSIAVMSVGVQKTAARKASSGHGLPLTTQHTASPSRCSLNPGHHPMSDGFLSVGFLSIERTPLPSTTPPSPCHGRPAIWQPTGPQHCEFRAV